MLLFAIFLFNNCFNKKYTIMLLFINYLNKKHIIDFISNTQQKIVKIL